MRTVKFQYTFGGNIELDVIAVISSGRRETPTEPAEEPEVEIASVRWMGVDIEIDDIMIAGTHSPGGIYLGDILAEQALEAETAEEIFPGTRAAFGSLAIRA